MLLLANCTYLHYDTDTQYVIALLGSKFKYNWSVRSDARILWKGVRRYPTFLSGIMGVALFDIFYAVQRF